MVKQEWPFLSNQEWPRNHLKCGCSCARGKKRALDVRWSAMSTPEVIHLIYLTIRWLKLVTWPYSTTRRLGSGHLLSSRCEDNFWWAARSWQAMLMRATALWDIVLIFTIQYGLVKTWPHPSMIWVSIWEQPLCVYMCVCMCECVCVCVCVCVTVGGTGKKGEGQRRGEERRKIMSIYRPNKTLSGNGELSWECVQINPGCPTIKRECGSCDQRWTGLRTQTLGAAACRKGSTATQSQAR